MLNYLATPRGHLIMALFILSLSAACLIWLAINWYRHDWFLVALNAGSVISFGICAINMLLVRNSLIEEIRHKEARNRALAEIANRCNEEGMDD